MPDHGDQVYVQFVNFMPTRIYISSESPPRSRCHYLGLITTEYNDIHGSDIIIFYFY
jgi:hypothetical protein